MKHIILIIVTMSFLFSCELENGSLTTINKDITSQYLLNGDLDIYIQNNQIFRYTGKPGVESIPIGNADLSKYEQCFVLYVASGTTPETTVSSAIIRLDGLEVLNTSDFSKNMGQYTFEVCNLTQTSILTVEVRGEPGSYVNVWIEGKISNRGTFVDERDGKVYKTIKIGNQIWMAENLAYLPENVYPPTDNSSTDPRYYVYDYDGTDKEQAKQTENYQNWGVLYNAAAALKEGTCPAGWHLPSDAEWTQLAQFIKDDVGDWRYQFFENPLSGELRGIGHHLKTISGWGFLREIDDYDLPVEGDDKYGFSGKPSGSLHCQLDAPNITWFEGGTAWFGFWSSTSSSWDPYCPTWDPTWDSKTTFHSWFTSSWISMLQIYKDRSATMGFSIRCVKDND